MELIFKESWLSLIVTVYLFQAVKHTGAITIQGREGITIKTDLTK